MYCAWFCGLVHFDHGSISEYCNEEKLHTVVVVFLVGCCWWHKFSINLEPFLAERKLFVISAKKGQPFRQLRNHIFYQP
jgi:hypothetical protein